MTIQKKPSQTRAESLAEFYAAADTALFNQTVIAYVRDCSTATMERDRWAGGGIQFIKIGRAVKYRKSDVQAWLGQYQAQNSTSETVQNDGRLSDIYAIIEKIGQ